MPAARLLLPSWRLRFYRGDGALTLVYGRSDAAPAQYDLALLAPAVMGAQATELSPGPEGAAPAPAGALSPRVFWIGLAAAVAILLALIVRLISTPSPPPSPPAP